MTRLEGRALAEAPIVEEADEPATVPVPVVAAPAAALADAQAPGPAPAPDDAAPAVVRKTLAQLFKQPEAALVALRNDAVMTAQVVAPPVDALQLIQQILDVKRCGAALEKKAAAKALRDHLDPLTPADHAVCQFCECQPTFKLHESVEFTLK